MLNKFKEILLNNKQNYKRVIITNDNSEDFYLDEIAKYLDKDKIDILELVNKDYPIKKFVQLAVKIRDLTGVFNSLLIINSDFTPAKIINADGLILKTDSLGIEYLTKLTDENFLFGFETSCYDEALKAQKYNYDFIVTDKIYENLTIKQYLLK